MYGVSAPIAFDMNHNVMVCAVIASAKARVTQSAIAHEMAGALDVVDEQQVMR